MKTANFCKSLPRNLAVLPLLAGSAPVFAGAAAGSITFSPLAATAQGIPVMGGSMLILLSLLLGLIAVVVMKKRNVTGMPLAVVALVAGGIASGAGGIKLVSTSEALNPEVIIESAEEQSFDLYLLPNRFENNAPVAFRVQDITPPFGTTCSSEEGAELVACDVGSTLAQGETCVVVCDDPNSNPESPGDGF